MAIGDQRKISWIASFPKSGNTWLRLIIDRLMRPGAEVDVNGASGRLPYFASKLSHALRSSGIYLDEKTSTQVRKYWYSAQESVATNAEGTIFLKTHNIATTFDTGPFPHPKFTRSAVYILRDPRDVALSYAHHYQCSLDVAVEAMCNEGLTLFKSEEPEKTELLKSWGQHVEAWTTPKQYPVLVLQYEELLADPASNIRRLAEFLKLPSDQETVRVVAESTDFAVLKANEKRQGFSEATNPEGFFRSGTARQWENSSQSKSLEPLVNAFRATMTRWGYLP